MHNEEITIKEINENIRQHRLYRIQTTDQKIRKFKSIHDEIKEHLVIKFTKNASLNVIRLVLGLITLIFIGVSILYFFPDKLITFMEANGEILTQDEKNEIYLDADFLGCMFLILSFISIYIGYLLKKNIRSRNSIFKLNKLIKEVIEYMESTSYDEKRKYEFYVDNLQEIENQKRKNSYTNNSSGF